jgi:outer membrane protein TolC
VLAGLPGCGTRHPATGQGRRPPPRQHTAFPLAQPSLGRVKVTMRAWTRSSILLLLLAARAAWAEPRSLALAEAVAQAVRGNPALAAAGADVGIARAAVLAARGLDDFVLDAGVSYRHNRRELVAGTPVQTPALDGVSASVALTRPFASGGRIGLRLLGDYSLTRFTTQLDPMTVARSTSEEYAPSLQLTFFHPLLRGLGPRVARADQRRAREQNDLAAAQRQGVAAGLIRDVVSSYWDLAYATQELAIRRAAAASARDQLRQVQANIAVGKQPRSASAEIEVAIALRDDAVLQAEQVLSDRAVDLARLCGLPIVPGGGPMVRAADTPAPAAERPDGPSTLAVALAHNPQLQAVRAQGRAAAIEIDVTENGLLPQLDLAAAAGPVGNGHDLSTAYQQLKGLQSYTITAGLVFQEALPRHAARGAREAASEALRKVKLTESDIAGQVAAAVARGIAAVDTAGRRAEVLSRSTEAAALDLAAEKARFEVGRSTNFDVLRRQDSLAAVQLVLLRAKVDHLKALADVEAATGEILGRHDVVLR